MFRDYEQPIIPPDWRDSWFTFAKMVISALDELHEPIKEKDLVKALQEKIDNGATPAPTPIDTGWVDLKSYKTGNWNVGSGNFLMARRVGNVVHIRVKCAATASMSGSGTFNSFTTAIPEEFRPDYDIYAVVTARDEDNGWVRIRTGGAIQITRNASGITNGWWITGDIVYTVDAPTT